MGAIMNNDIEKNILHIIEKYEALTHEDITYRVEKAMKSMNLNKTERCLWIAEHCLEPGRGKDSVYFWLSPSRSEKMPLKVLAKFSLEMQIPLVELLEKPEITNPNLLRERKLRKYSYENKVKEYVTEHPKASVKEIAEALGIVPYTVQRHLKNMEKGE